MSNRLSIATYHSSSLGHENIMATIDTSRDFILTNSYTGSDTALDCSSSDGTLGMSLVDPSVADSQRWFVATTDISPFYRLHTIFLGTSQSLDVINDNGTNSIYLHMTGTGQYTGQYWRFDPWPSGDAGGGYRLSNNFTGPDMHLDVYSDTLQPHLADGDYTGQHWTLGGGYCPNKRN